MRVLGLDIGEKRIGVAVSDPAGRVATALIVLDASTARGGLSRLVQDYEPALIVVGLPLSMDGSEGPQAARVKRTVARLQEELSVPFAFTDERLTSAEASRRMREAGVPERRQRGAKDMVAASILLQAYLDSADHAGSVEEPG